MTTDDGERIKMALISPLSWLFYSMIGALGRIIMQ